MDGRIPNGDYLAGAGSSHQRPGLVCWSSGHQDPRCSGNAFKMVIEKRTHQGTRLRWRESKVEREAVEKTKTKNSKRDGKWAPLSAIRFKLHRQHALGQLPCLRETSLVRSSSNAPKRHAFARFISRSLPGQLMIPWSLVTHLMERETYYGPFAKGTVALPCLSRDLQPPVQNSHRQKRRAGKRVSD